MTKPFIFEKILVAHENFQQTIHQNRSKANIERDFKRSIVCSNLKHQFFSLEIPYSDCSLDFEKRSF